MSRFQDFDFSVDQLATEAPSMIQIDATDFTTTATELVEVSDLSDEQEMILSLLQVFSATLSLVGSCTILYKILRSLCRNQTTTPYDRIIFGLSCCDIVASSTYALGPFLLPRETSQRVWAFGNDSTCQKLGFLLQLSCMWAIWYNCMLSFYYLLTVRFQVKREVFVRKYEPWMHLSGAVFFPTTSLMGYVGGWYAEEALAMGCWVGEVRTNCDEETGVCSETWGELVAYIFGALPTLITLFAVIVNNVIIYVFVRKSLSPTRNRTAASEPEHRHDSAHDNASRSGSESDCSSDRHSIQERLTREAAIQGFLYVSTFLLTVLPAFTVQILDGSLGFQEDYQGTFYPLLVLNSILLPLQGFFNVFIYVRPSYSRFNAVNPEQPKWKILKQALFDPNIPRMSSTQGVSSDPISGSEKKPNSKLKQKVGSNFSMSLDNIVEEVREDQEEGARDDGSA